MNDTILKRLIAERNQKRKKPPKKRPETQPSVTEDKVKPVQITINRVFLNAFKKAIKIISSNGNHCVIVEEKQIEDDEITISVLPRRNKGTCLFELGKRYAILVYEQKIF